MNDVNGNASSGTGAPTGGESVMPFADENVYQSPSISRTSSQVVIDQ